METIFGFLGTGASAILPFIVLLGLLIFVHEMGHFLVAKFFGVRVEVFSLGFGKKILKYKKGDTTYCLSLIPLGGYVKMFGDDPNAPIALEEQKYSFTHKPVSQRIGVVIAGPLMNFFFAILVLFVVALIGQNGRAPIIGDVIPGTSAYESGFRSGDQILSVAGQNIKTWDDFAKAMTNYQGQPVSIQIQRENSNQLVEVTSTSQLVENPNILSLNKKIGEIEGITQTARAPVVGVRTGSVAHKAGLRTGDLIRSVAAHNVKYFRELDNALVSQQGRPIVLEITRFKNLENDSSEKLAIQVPQTSFASMAALGIEQADLYLAKVMDGTPAQAAGLRDGDRILQVNDMTPTRWEDVLNTVKNYSGDGSLVFQIEREGVQSTLDIVPKKTSQTTSFGGEEQRYTVGILTWSFPAAPETILIKTDSPIEALSFGWRRTIEITEMTVLSFVRLIETKISPKNIGGIISIGQAASETYKMGLSYFLQMMAAISVNLFVLNLLPVPVLDGGHLVFYTIEAVKGAPLGIKKMEFAQKIGLVVLMSLMVFALFNDVTRVFGNW
jgi:regulator of sigma E protease